MKICTVCKIERNDDQFISKAGRTNLKNCLRCRLRKREKKCQHGKRKSRCIDCGGSAICQHGSRKDNCKLCGCQHGKRKSRCIDCGGSAICQHDKRKDNCKLCKN